MSELTNAVRQHIDDCFPEFRERWGNTNTEVALDMIMAKLTPILEAAEEMRKRYAPESMMPTAVAYDAARAALVKDKT